MQNKPYIIWGMSGKGHDASIVVFKDYSVVFESYTRDSEHDVAVIEKIKHDHGEPNLVVWYENPWKKMLRQWWDGHKNVYASNNISKYLKSKNINCPYTYVDHHRSHYGHSFQSPYDNPLVIVADSIGEFDCTSVWYNNRKISSINYPHSIGLFYSSMTQASGLRPNCDEGLFERIASENEIDLDLKDHIKKLFIVEHDWAPLFKVNLHKGTDIRISAELLAPVVQSIFEDLIINIYNHWTTKLNCNEVIFTGGCAFNKGIRNKINIWVPANPGDGGSAKSCVWSYLNG